MTESLTINNLLSSHIVYHHVTQPQVIGYFINLHSDCNWVHLIKSAGNVLFKLLGIYGSLFYGLNIDPEDKDTQVQMHMNICVVC